MSKDFLDALLARGIREINLELVHPEALQPPTGIALVLFNCLPDRMGSYWVITEELSVLLGNLCTL